MATVELKPGQLMTILENAASVAREAANAVIAKASRAIAADGVFRMALAGGTTPMRAYHLLRHEDLPWQRIEVFFGDERCLPVGDPGRNDTMAIGALLSHVPVPASHIHAIPAELGPEPAAIAYARTIEKSLPLHLVLLGMGEDGHTASLFPGQKNLNDNRLVLPVHNAPKPPPERVSMGFRAINGAMERLVMVTGSSKSLAMSRLKSGETLPIGMLGPSRWLVDKDAWHET